MPDYTLEAQIKGNSSDFEKAAKDAGNAAKDLGKQTEKAGKDAKNASANFKDLSDKLDGAASKMQKLSALMIGSLASGFSAAALKGVQFNAQMEQYTATFETFTGSAEEAANTMDRLLELGAQTPFETTDLADATQLLMAYGFTADEAVNSLTMLGDASQGNAEKLTSIATGFARMKSSGKVTLEYLNLMIENGFNPLNQVAEDTGMTMAEIYDAISDGAITFEQVQSAMQKMTSEGGQYFGLMEKQSQTLNGRLSTLSDTVQMKLGEAFSGLTDKINEALPYVIDFIDNLDVESVFDGLITLTSLFVGLFTAATALRGVIALINFATVEGQVVSLGKAISAKLMAPMASFASSAVTVLAPVVVPLLAIAATVALVGMAIKELWETNEYFAESLINIIYSIEDIVSNAWNTIIKPIMNNVVSVLINVYNSGIKPLWNQFIQFINVVVTKFSELMDAVYPVVNWFIETFGPVLVQIFNYVANVFGSAVTTILNIAGALLGNMGEVIGGIMDTFKGIIEFLTGVFTGDWSKAWQGVVDIFGGIFSTITGILKAPINGVIGIINGAIGGINSISVDVPDWVPFVGGQHWGLDLPLIPYLLHGTDDWQGGFAYMNEGGRGELTYLPDGSQVIPHDISVKYAQEAARLNSSADSIDISGLLEGLVIEIDNSVYVGDRTIREDIANYTIKKIGNRYKAVLATKGGS